MVNSGTYAEIVDRHVELYSRLYWWGGVLDESEPLEEHHIRPKLSRVSPATQTLGTVDDEWLCENLVAISQLAESLDRGSFELAFGSCRSTGGSRSCPSDRGLLKIYRPRRPTEPA
jgi:hypothetical protein